MLQEQHDASLFTELQDNITLLDDMLSKLEFQRMFNNPMDPNPAFLEIQSGSGGTEAQDWAEMLMRMYLRWGLQNNMETEVLEVSKGDVAGIKGATIRFSGDHAYGWLRGENGIHRLVRKSPFDSGNRRHTSFASVFISPEIDDSVEIDINPDDLKIDTFRASGAGGQHVNKTESAIRITHKVSGIVVECQEGRSQHQNKAKAMTLLRSKLYELEIQKRNAQKQELEDSKSDISWGNQIRSYVLDQSRIKDLRTNFENSNCTAVLNGEINGFLEANLKYFSSK